MSQKCKPVHDWKMPEAGDDALVCLTCGRSMSFHFEMTLDLMGSIMRGRRSHYEDGDRFATALLDAMKKDRERRGENRRLAPPVNHAPAAKVAPKEIIPKLKPHQKQYPSEYVHPLKRKLQGKGVE